MKLLRLSPKMPARAKVAVIARVAAHRAFVARGLQSLGTEVYQTPYGPSRPVHFFVHAGLTFVVLSRHGEAGYEISAPFPQCPGQSLCLEGPGGGKDPGLGGAGVAEGGDGPGGLGGAPRRAGRRAGRAPHLLSRGGVGFHPAPPAVLPGAAGRDAGGVGRGAFYGA